MYNRIRILQLLVPAALLAVGIAHADSVKSDYSHSVDFSSFHTYSWGDVKTANPLYVDRVRQAVDQALQAKGWQLVPNGGDTTVFANGQIRNEQQLETMYNSLGPGWGGGWGWGGWGWGRGGGFGTATTTTTTQPVGSLVIDIFTVTDKKLAWRGIIERDISDKAEKNTKGLDKDIQKLFKDFPPKGRG
jgi:hypothetical protein